AREKAIATQSPGPSQGDGTELTPTQEEKPNQRKRKRKRKRDEEAKEKDDDEPDRLSTNQLPVDLTLLDDSILAEPVASPSLFLPDYDPSPNIDPALLPPDSLISRASCPDHLYVQETSAVDETASRMIAEEVSTFLQNSQGTLLSEAL